MWRRLYDWWRKQQRRDRGKDGEAEAEKCLRALGYRTLARRHRNRGGEIDLIMRDGETVVFVEVKSRVGTAGGHPTEAVTRDKQQRLGRAALIYLQRAGNLSTRCRFDVVAVTWPKEGGAAAIVHYRHAFEPPARGQLWG